jgi:hypothetical protein
MTRVAFGHEPPDMGTCHPLHQPVGGIAELGKCGARGNWEGI